MSGLDLIKTIKKFKKTYVDNTLQTFINRKFRKTTKASDKMESMHDIRLDRFRLGLVEVD